MHPSKSTPCAPPRQMKHNTCAEHCPLRGCNTWTRTMRNTCISKWTLEHLVALYDLAGMPGLFLTAAQSTTFKDTVDKLLAHYNWLARKAQDSGLKRWNTILEFHYLAHLAKQCRYLHCRAGATYLDEDFMGRMKALAKKSYCGQLLKCP